MEVVLLLVEVEVLVVLAAMLLPLQNIHQQTVVQDYNLTLAELQHITQVAVEVWDFCGLQTATVD
jgi:hypothetical protein